MTNTAKAQSPFQIAEVRNLSEANRLLRLAIETGQCAFDTETTGDRPKIGKEEVGLRWALGDHAFMATFAATEDASWACYNPDLTRYILFHLHENRVPLVMHNGRFDLQLVRAWNGWVPESGYADLRIEDTMFGFRCLQPGQSAKLKEASARIIPADFMDTAGPERAVKLWLEQKRHSLRTRVAGKWVATGSVTYADVPKEIMLPYASQDAILTLICHNRMARVWDKHPEARETYERELRLIPVIIEIERAGMPIDEAVLEARYSEAKDRLLISMGKWAEIAPQINPLSSKQLVHYLYDVCGEPVRQRTEKNQPSADEAALRSLDNQDVSALLLDIRHWKKAYDKYQEFKNYSVRGYLHSDLKADGARTGRFSSAAPQLHNTARPDDTKPWTQIRGVVRPKAGSSLVFVDWDSIEMRLFCHFAQDPELIKVFEQNRKVHRFVASRIYGIPEEQVTKQQYDFGKTLGFCILYGGGVRKVTESLAYGAAASDPLTRLEALQALSQFTGVLTNEERENPYPKLAQCLLDAYYSAFPTVRAFTKSMAQQAATSGKIVNAFGRTIAIPKERSYIAGNALIQGSAADMMKEALIRVRDKATEWCGLSGFRMWGDVSLNLSIHDEIVSTVPEGYESEYARWIKPTMTTWPQFSVPIKCEFAVVRPGGDWAHKEALEV